jgi:hypothetical protein
MLHPVGHGSDTTRRSGVRSCNQASRCGEGAGHRRIVTSEVFRQLPERVTPFAAGFLRRRKTPACASFRGGRYWARTSDPELVDRQPGLAPRSGSGFVRAFGRRFRHPRGHVGHRKTYPKPALPANSLTACASVSSSWLRVVAECRSTENDATVLSVLQ